jgi:ribulose-5-phosphate 4-epimerase/fuculose-1-phosphate aldolase
VLLGRHGVLTFGKDLHDAWNECHPEEAAKTYAMACLLGKPTFSPKTKPGALSTFTTIATGRSKRVIHVLHRSHLILLDIDAAVAEEVIRMLCTRLEEAVM